MRYIIVRFTYPVLTLHQCFGSCRCQMHARMESGRK